MLSRVVKDDGFFSSPCYSFCRWFVWQPEILGKYTLAHSLLLLLLLVLLFLSHSVRLLSGSCLTRHRPNGQVMFMKVDDGNTNNHRSVGTQYSIRIQTSLMGTYYFGSH